MARIILLTEGHTEPSHAKTAASILRYRGDEVVGLIDSTAAGRDPGELLGVGGGKPIRARLDELGEADELMVGVAPVGLYLPEAWRDIILEAIDRGMNVTSGIHVFLGEDPEIASAARARGVRLWDVRTPPEGIGCSADVARDQKPLRVHSVGTDCVVGKMTVTIEIDRALRERGIASKFLATGQTGIMVSGAGYPIDRMISDFVAGGAEALVMENLDCDAQLIEGQGSLYHPMYSGVTLGLLHGCAPDFLILCYDPMLENLVDTRRHVRPVAEALEAYDRAANWMHPCKVIGIAGVTWRMGEAEARAELDRVERETGLPTTDPIRFGCDKLIAAILETPRPSTGEIFTPGDAAKGAKSGA